MHYDADRASEEPSDVVNQIISTSGYGFGGVLVGRRVLLVGYDDDRRQLFTLVLQLAGAEVRIADTAPEAVDAVTAWQLHAVVTRLLMEEHDGYWLLRQIRRLPSTGVAGTPVVAISGQDDLEAMTAAGFNACLTGPVANEVLVQAVAESLSLCLESDNETVGTK